MRYEPSTPVTATSALVAPAAVKSTLPFAIGVPGHDELGVVGSALMQGPARTSPWTVPSAELPASEACPFGVGPGGVAGAEGPGGVPAAADAKGVAAKLDLGEGVDAAPDLPAAGEPPPPGPDEGPDEPLEDASPDGAGLEVAPSDATLLILRAGVPPAQADRAKHSATVAAAARAAMTAYLGLTDQVAELFAATGSVVAELTWSVAVCSFWLPWKKKTTWTDRTPPSASVG